MMAILSQAALLQSIKLCTARGLTYSAKWAAEMASAVDPDSSSEPDAEAALFADPPLPPADLLPYTLAKVYFDLQQYDRAAHVLRHCAGDQAFFLRLYATYLSGEKRREEQQAVDTTESTTFVNDTLVKLGHALQARQNPDAFSLYLWGIVLAEQNQKIAAMNLFARSVQLYPYLWSAWHELSSACVDLPDLDLLPSLCLPAHPVAAFFDALVHHALHQHGAAMALYRALGAVYPRSTHVRAQIALTHYYMREFEAARALLEAQRVEDPFSVDHADVLSNILFVLDKPAELSRLAHDACKVDAYRAETNVAIGNYYSARRQHEKAVLYFQRALRIDWRFFSAWTLMGHEYLELKNTSAAIAAYRRCVDIAPRDYRAWYGLGQTYEMLGLPLFALHYFTRAQAFNTRDARLWDALALTYETLSRWADAVVCYERVLDLSSGNAESAVFNLGLLYRDKITPRDLTKAAYFFQMVVAMSESEGEGSASNKTLEASVFLSRFFKEQGDLITAQKYASLVMGYGGKHKEDAKSLLKEIQALGGPAHASPRAVSGPLDQAARDGAHSLPRAQSRRDADNTAASVAVTIADANDDSSMSM